MLHASQKDRLLRLFAEGVELPAAERPAFVARTCADDPELRRELGELLEVEAKPLAGFLVEPAVAPATAGAIAAVGAMAADPAPMRLPEIDGYAQFERIAEGGMGTVYRAVQLRPVRRTVAIKRIRPGMDTDTVLARFAVERQALALMSHPYIAAVYDAGTDAMGQPFLAMEFVDGVPITEYCQRERVPLDDRLRLFVKVCGAVDHAHRRGVLHRDLKPSNVLVSRRGDEAMPKVIDFGIAKALEEPLGEQSIHTLAGSFLGTPEYMAPEQIDGGAQLVDTRSDVYSLGVVLYELVSGMRPIDPATLRVTGVVQLTRLVRDAVPQKPSTRLRQRAASAAESEQPFRWAKRVAGDLDWIVMRALEKEPDRRYGSPRELAQDIERFLEHRPVNAGPPSGLYQLRKFARRYRVQVVAAALVLLSLVLGLSGTLWFLVVAKANEQAAIARARQAEGVRIAAEAALVAKTNPNLALLLALEASARTDDSAVRQSIYDALSSHCMQQRLCGHDLGINQGGGVFVHYLADGRLLDSGASDVVLWDPETGAQLQRFAGPRDSFGAVAISPDERLLLAASYDGSAYLWDLATGATLRVDDDHTAELRSCAFSPDGSRFATTSIDGTARVHATHEQRPPIVLAHGHAVGAVAFDPGGNRLVTFAADRRTRIWDLATGRLEVECAVGRHRATISDEAMRGSELFLAPRIGRIASSAGNTILVHTAGGELVAEVEAAFPRRYGDDRLIVTLDGDLGILDLRSGAVDRHAELRLCSATPTPDGRFAVAIDHKLDVCLLDLASMRIVRHYLGPADKAWRPPIAFHPDGRRFAVLAQDLRVWNLEAEFAPFDVPNAARTTFRYSPVWGGAPIAVVRAAGPTLGAGAWDVWDTAARRRRCEVRRPGMSFLEPSLCGTKLIGGVPENGARGWRILVLDLDGRVLREILLSAYPPGERDSSTCVRWAIDRSGKLLVTMLDDDRTPEPDGTLLQCHDLDTGELLAQVPHAGGVPTWVAAPDSGLVALVGWQRRYIEVLDWRSGAVRARVSRPPDGMHLEAAVSADGRYLLGTLGEPLAFVWDLDGDRGDLSSHPLVTYTGLLAAGGYPCGFLDHARLCWVACNYEVHLFEPESGKVFAVLRLPGACTHVAESPDGAAIVTQTDDGRVQRYPLDPLAAARRLAVGQLDGKRLAQYRIGTPEQRRAAERVHLLANVSPGNHAQLGALALADGDLDEAIASYQRGADLGVLGPYYAYLYLDLVGLYCRRLERTDRSAAECAADRRSASAALRQALACGATADDVRALPACGLLRGEPFVDDLLGK